MAFSEKQLEVLRFPHTGYDALICDGAVRSGKTSVMSLSFILWAMNCFQSLDPPLPYSPFHGEGAALSGTAGGDVLGRIGGQRRFWNVMQAQSVMRSNFGMQLVNKGDQITNTQYTFTGLSDVHESMCLSLSGASRIPMTKLFGRSPAGMNATGESDLRNYYDYVDTLRESKLAPMLRRLLPVLAMSALGTVPEDLDISFPPLWTPTAKEVAEIARDKAETIVSVFQAGLIQADTAQRELKKLSGETDLFDSITDEEIAANKGKTYQDVTALRDPLVGLGYGGAETGPFALTTGDALVMDFNPHHDPASGRFTNGGGGGTIGKTKYAPSPQRNKSGIQLKPKTYAKLCGTLGTKFPGLEAGEVRKIRDAKSEYLVKADGYGGFTVIEVYKIK